jgi:hypothetical protein
VNIADGVNTWGIDLAAGNLRFHKGRRARGREPQTRRRSQAPRVGLFNTTPITAKSTATADATDLATVITRGQHP